MHSVSCPKCGSQDWKSAKLIVLEGTTQTVGDIEGSGSTPSTFSGGINNFLLADSWFSRDFPLQLDVGLTTTTALAEEIKAFMSDQMDKIPRPIEPTPPEALSFWKKIKPTKGIAEKEKMPVKPDPPKKPVEPIKPQHSPETEDEKANKNTLGENVYLLLMFTVVAAFVYIEFFSDTLEGGYTYSIKSFENFYGLPNVVSPYIDTINAYIFAALLIITLTPLLNILLRPLNDKLRAAKHARKEAKNARYDKDYKNYQHNLELYEAALKKFNETSLAKYEIALKKATDHNKQQERLKEAEYQQALADHDEKLEVEKTKQRLYAKEMSKYEVACQQYDNKKLALWEQAAVCMRCGAAFAKKSDQLVN